MELSPPNEVYMKFRDKLVDEQISIARNKGFCVVCLYSYDAEGWCAGYCLHEDFVEWEKEARLKELNRLNFTAAKNSPSISVFPDEVNENE